jgi:beta-N-acetylhexosaminidase
MKPVIIGCRTLDFTPEQLAVFADQKPFGMIIFLEVCEKGPETIKHVIKQFRDAVGWDAPIFIDNEGGLVNRFKPAFNHGWAEIPGHRVIGDVYQKNQAAGKELAFLVAQLIADQMIELGVNVNCAPVVDRVAEELVKPNTDGKQHATSSSFFNRTFSDDIDTIVTLASEYMRGLESRGVIPVVKHVPGYGRVSKDPHYSLPVVTASHEELSATDFEIFKRLNGAKSMMTGHLIYTDIDDKRSATISPKIIGEVVRGEIGFKGLLIPDTIEMAGIAPELFDNDRQQLFGLPWPKPGAMGQITKWCIEAGCDVVLHSDLSRDFSHTVEILEATEHVSSEKEKMMKNDFALVNQDQIEKFDRIVAVERIKSILGN